MKNGLSNDLKMEWDLPLEVGSGGSEQWGRSVC